MRWRLIASDQAFRVGPEGTEQRGWRLRSRLGGGGNRSRQFARLDRECWYQVGAKICEYRRCIGGIGGCWHSQS
ncbi:hypothetical protein AcV7_004555 [Taiwanofungus camphoratus]|nr:hypothetical protein AcV7_004555 [Antrodia cinnamomea]